MNLETSRSIQNHGTVTRLEIALSVGFFGLMSAIVVFVFFSTNPLLTEQSREAAVVAMLALCIAVGGIGVRGRFVPNEKRA
ncbi:MAG: hypothetical protein AB1817_07410 [Chloroflexota bacterium]